MDSSSFRRLLVAQDSLIVRGVLMNQITLLDALHLDLKSQHALSTCYTQASRAELATRAIVCAVHTMQKPFVAEEGQMPTANASALFALGQLQQLPLKQAFDAAGFLDDVRDKEHIKRMKVDIVDIHRSASEAQKLTIIRQGQTLLRWIMDNADGPGKAFITTSYEFSKSCAKNWALKVVPEQMMVNSMRSIVQAVQRSVG
jgi:hypothetical protein